MNKKETVMEEKRKQLGYLDILRWTAIAMVVMLHVISGVSDTIAVEMNQGQKIVYETVKNLMTAGVPIFLMISGALFLTPEKKITIERLLKHYVRRILLALLIFGTVFAVMELVMTERTFSLTMVGKGFLMTLSGNTWAHMWYLYELIGLYLITPLLKVVIAYGGKRLLEYGLLLGFCFSSILPFAEQLTGFYLGFTYPFAGIYLFYYVAGYYLRDCVEWSWKIGGAVAAVMGVILIVNGFCLQLFPVSYDSPWIVLMSMGIFLAVSRANVSGSWFSVHRGLCFGIYLIHPVFLNFFYKFLHITPLRIGYAGILIFWILTFVLSCVAAQIMIMIPPLRKYVV